MPPRPRGHSGGAFSTAFVLVGAATVLGTTFAAGMYAGTWWSSAPRSGLAAGSGAGSAGSTRAAEHDPRRSTDARADKPKAAMPTLTFYQELTAPLTAPAPPVKPKATRGDAPRLASSDASAARESGARESTARESSSRGAGAAATDGSPRSYTIQVGAYKSREPAEALRTKLVAAGLQAEVVTAEVAAGARFRVRIGAYPTRDAAREAAARLAAERALPTLVTAR